MLVYRSVTIGLWRTLRFSTNKSHGIFVLGDWVESPDVYRRVRWETTGPTQDGMEEEILGPWSLEVLHGVSLGPLFSWPKINGFPSRELT